MKRHWRTLAELADDSAFLARAAEEFPHLAEALAAPVSRRRALQLMAASMALGGLSGCGSPGTPFDKMTVAPVQAPGIIAALPNYYATASVFDGYGAGVIVKHLMGRPIKVEGNPLHPASLGATDVHGQAMLLDFYDPARAVPLFHQGEPIDRQQLEWALTHERSHLKKTRGAGFRILTGSFTSPTMAAQIATLLHLYPEATWHPWDAIPRDAVRKGAVLAYGREVEIVPHPAEADVILALESDLLHSAPGHVRLAREFVSRRNPTQTRSMNRVYSVEATPGLMGAVADNHLVAGPAEMHRIVLGLAAGIMNNQPPSGAPDWLPAVIADLKQAGGRALILAGPDLPAEAHALVHAMNETLGRRGTTFDVIEPVLLGSRDAMGSLRELTEAMHAGRVDNLLIVGVNPVFTAPPTLGFREGLSRVRFTLTTTQQPDETSAASAWFVPEAHSFETWTDARAYDGTATIMQPQALPLWNAISAHETLDLFATPFTRSPLALVRATWKQQLPDEPHWRQAMADGVVPGSAAAKADVKLLSNAANVRPPAPPPYKLHVLFRPDPNLWDGRYANNPWLQELPRPLSKLTWDNPLLISPELARGLNFAGSKATHSFAEQHHNVMQLTVGAARVTAAAWIMPGQAPDCIVALLGYGRRIVGEVGGATGFDYYPLRGQVGEPVVKTLDEHYPLATTDHHNPLDRPAEDIVLHGTLSKYHEYPFFLHQGEGTKTLYSNHRPTPTELAWGMSVDLNRCVGCNACVLACVAENNVPMVGKNEVLVAREMFWLRIDRYYAGTAENPDTYFQPMLCQHCEEAPCEVVCPVEATLHNDEGVNLMIYNRCIGTRFCSNNCPYKVRRFNFRPFAKYEPRMDVSRNPDLTVRARGVMEKCTFCIQRIAAARIDADKENRPIRDGEVVVACQAACPTQAFVFGNMNDPEAAVSKRKQSPLNYVLLPETSSHPRLTYEALISNPNPAVPGAESA